MYTLDGKWKLELKKYGLKLPGGQAGGGRVILLHATNITNEETFPLTFTGKITSEGIITSRIKKQFGILLPGETEEIALNKVYGVGKDRHAGKNVVTLFFDTTGLSFEANSGGCKFLGEIPSRQDMFVRTSLDESAEWDQAA